MEVYFPKTAVSQVELEKDFGVKTGKFTIGLGQQNMAFCSAAEDINSIMLSAVQSLLEKYHIDPNDIGRLEVGTETLVDKSKSVKSTLTQLFNAHGNFDLEGVDSINACYGGTAALLNTIAWVESSAFDGRYGLVVCGDIAVYEDGPARPTGGVAAVAMLVGPDAPIAHDGIRASHMEDAYDFYKPNLASEYPVVFGHDSNLCYLRALDGCYQRYAKRYEMLKGEAFNLGAVDHVVLHSPYNKLVKKSGARMLYNDFQRYPEMPIFNDPEHVATLSELKGLPQEKSYAGKDADKLNKCFEKLARTMYATKVEPGCVLPRELGNSYTASMYTGLLSLIDSFANKMERMVGKEILMFSYGSGLAATMYRFTVRSDINFIAQTVDLPRRLSARAFLPPALFKETLRRREEQYTKKGYTNEPDEALMFPGTFYLAANDEHGRRSYKRYKMLEQQDIIKELPSASNLARRSAAAGQVTALASAARSKL